MDDRTTAQAFGVLVCVAALGVVFWRGQLARAHRQVRALGVWTGIGAGLVVLALSIVFVPGAWAAVYRFFIARYSGE